MPGHWKHLSREAEHKTIREQPRRQKDQWKPSIYTLSIKEEREKRRDEQLEKIMINVAEHVYMHKKKVMQISLSTF